MKASKKIQGIVSAKKIIWYFCVLSMFLVCCITIAIVYKNPDKLIINSNETTLFMSIIGILFGFSAISIYSIFNATIEGEKRQFILMRDELETEMQQYKDQWYYSLLLIRYYQTCQMIIDSQSFNAQVIDWVLSLSREIDSFKKYLQALYDNYDESRFYARKRDLIIISRGIRIHLNSFYGRINDSSSSFFQGIYEEDKKNFLANLEQTIDNLDNLEEYNPIDR